MRLLVALLVGAGCVTATQAVTWDLANDFSSTDNPNGPWSYGQLSAGVFVPATHCVNSGWLWWQNANNTVTVGKNIGASFAYGIQAGHATLEADYLVPAAIWTAPITGIFEIRALMGGSTASAGGGFGNAAAHLARLNIAGIDQTADAFVNNVKSWSRSGVSLNAGDKVMVWVGEQWGGGNTDTTLTIEGVPEPGTISVLAMGALGALVRRRRK